MHTGHTFFKHSLVNCVVALLVCIIIGAFAKPCFYCASELRCERKYRERLTGLLAVSEFCFFMKTKKMKNKYP